MISRKMCCSARTGRALGLTFLILATVACGLSFVSPYWTDIGGVLTTGLWGNCTQEFNIKDIIGSVRGCQWFLDDKFAWEKERDDWQYACQFFSGLGVVCFILAVPTACGSICCCHSKRAAYFTGVTAIFASVFQAVSLGVWGYYLHNLFTIIPFVDGDSGRADWAYYLGIGGVLVGFLAGGLFFCKRDTGEEFEKV